jgi:putative SOS response-associated peptidase YedK
MRVDDVFEWMSHRGIECRATSSHVHSRSVGKGKILQGHWAPTLAMIGTDANESAGRLHHHTPVTLHRQDDEGRALQLDRRGLLRPFASPEQEASFTR